MVAVHQDFVETVLPGELADEHWEVVQEADCLVCEEPCTPTSTGTCWMCERKYRASGAGCGLAAVLVAGGGHPAVVLSHLILCSDCRTLFLDLGRTAEAADLDAAQTHKSTYAVSLAAIA